MAGRRGWGPTLVGPLAEGKFLSCVGTVFRIPAASKLAPYGGGVRNFKWREGRGRHSSKSTFISCRDGQEAFFGPLQHSYRLMPRNRGKIIQEQVERIARL